MWCVCRLLPTPATFQDRNPYWPSMESPPRVPLPTCPGTALTESYKPFVCTRILVFAQGSGIRRRVTKRVVVGRTSVRIKLDRMKPAESLLGREPKSDASDDQREST